MNITSPNYPSNYVDNLSYNWKFRTNSGHLLLLKFSDFHLEPDCHDYVLVDYEHIIANYCGSDLPPDILSTSNTLLVLFRTDSSGQRKGFSADIIVYTDTTIMNPATADTTSTNPGTTNIISTNPATTDSTKNNPNDTTTTTDLTVTKVIITTSPEVENIALTSGPDSITFSTSTDSPIEKDGNYTIIAELETVDPGTRFNVENQDGTTLFSSSDIVTIDVYDDKGEKLSIKVEIKFPVIQNITIEKSTSVLQYKPECHFTKNVSSEAMWLTEGCSTLRYNNRTNGVICNCTHLTSFVVLLKPTQSNINDKSLSIITNVGLGISSLFLVIILITVYSFKNLRNSERHKILCHLVVALLIVNFFYAFLGLNVKNEIVCAVIAGCLHYSLLTAFAWMLIVSTDVYMKIKHPFVNHERRFLFSRYLGWIVPIIIVVVTAGCTRDKYVSEDVCWLNMGFAIWTFIIPMTIALVIIIVQIVVIGYIAFTKTRLPQQSAEDKNTNKRIRSLAYGIILLAPVVGLPWIFGIIIIFSSSKVMEYTFVIMNSLQGFFIWLSQCVFSNEVQYACKKKSANRTHPDTAFTMTDQTTKVPDKTDDPSYHRPISNAIIEQEDPTMPPIESD
ncbi:adhesion G protein-coupled receptor L4-like [Antedon mediterranea]|uniref:adhesion G protein-coupled receptor L4-like n=1 Tax=Antedon mediterranea TaxID=105859 RepID=UPI003AF55224